MAPAVRTLAFFLAITLSLSAQTPGIQSFLSELQRASAAGDAAAIAAMVEYPIAISIGGLRVPFGNAAEFVERYDDIFNEPLRRSIARASVSNGTLTGTTDIVIADVRGRMRITAITVPQQTDGTVAVEALSRGGTVTAERQEPRRVVIRVGPRPTQIPGLLGADAIDSLIVYLPKGRVAGVRLERIPVGAAVLRVVHARSGTPLATRASTDGRYTSGAPVESADYRIDVRRTGLRDQGPLPYMVSLTLR